MNLTVRQPENRESGSGLAVIDRIAPADQDDVELTMAHFEHAIDDVGGAPDDDDGPVEGMAQTV